MTTGEQNPTHTYRFNWKGMLYATWPLLYIEPDSASCLVIPMLVFLYVPSLFLSYLRVSDEGVELLHWPRYRVRARWDEVTRLDKCRAFGKFKFDALYLRESAQGEARKLADREMGEFRKNIISLTDFRGWPEGRLAEDIRRYLPQMYAKWEREQAEEQSRKKERP